MEVFKVLPSTSPAELGLTSFPAFRPFQPAIINRAVSSLLSQSSYAGHIPMGIGKSLIATTVAEILIRTGIIDQALYLTATKQLQSQYETTLGHYDLRGRSNYTCADYPTLNCMEAKPFCRCAEECPATNAKAESKSQRHVVSNYSYRFSNIVLNRDTSAAPDDSAPRTLLVCDEAHMIPELLLNNVNVVLSRASIHKLVRDISHQDHHAASFISSVPNLIDSLPFPARAQELPRGKQFRWYPEESKPLIEQCRKLYPEFSQVLNDLKTVVKAKANPVLGREVQQFDNIVGHIKTISTADCNQWVLDYRNPNEITFSCIAPSMLAKKYLIQDATHTMYMSGTLDTTPLRWMGLNINVDRVNPVFSPTRSPIRFVKSSPVMRYGVSQDIKNTWTSVIHSAIQSRCIDLQRNAVILASSFDQCKEIFHSSPLEDRSNFVTHGRVLGGVNSGETHFRTLDEAVELLLTCPDSGLVLLSPSASTGVDLPDGACRLVITAKVPYPQSGDKISKVLASIKPELSMSKAGTTMAQSWKRGMRHSQDWCEVLVLDGAFARFRVPANSHYIFHEQIFTTEDLPPPMPEPRY